MLDFSDSMIATQAQLRALMGEPVHPVVVAKTLPALDRHCRTFIGRSPFVLIASADAAGRTDISPKGDPAGFVRVLDDHTLAIPERPGNQRFDTLRNLIDNPRIGLIFLIPGKRETLRVSGSARIVTDQALRDSMAIKGKSPALAIVVDVEEAFFHCAKCMIRSGLWQPDKWPTLDGLPSLAEAMRDGTGIDAPVDALQALITGDEVERLY
ncbi:MAG: pyridoxamine 5'-phosphate oxidase family protein [Novosphingobium sp.]